jgi:hypothetical protein
VRKNVNAFIKKNLKITPDGGNATAAPPESRIMAADLIKAEEKAEKKRAAHHAAEGQVRKVVGEVHSAIGQVLDGAAQLASLSPIQLLGLSAHIAKRAEEEGFKAELNRLGFDLYASKYAHGVALTMLGVEPGAKKLAEALRDAGFIRAGHLWAGEARVPEAVRLATEHDLTLLRYDSDHTPTYFVRRGEKQPTLVALEAEYNGRIEAARQALLPITDQQGEPADGNNIAPDGAGSEPRSQSETAASEASVGPPVTGKALTAFKQMGTARHASARGSDAAEA